MTVPPGFEPLQTESPFNNHVGPYYARVSDDGLELGMVVKRHHCNRSGRLHGGMIPSLADIAIGNNIGIALAQQGESREQVTTGRAPMATVSMSTDYFGNAREGDWVYVRVDVQRMGKSLAFANAYVHRGKDRIARVSAVFRVFRERT